MAFAMLAMFFSSLYVGMTIVHEPDMMYRVPIGCNPIYLVGRLRIHPATGGPWNSDATGFLQLCL